MLCWFLLLLIIWCVYLQSRNKVDLCVVPMYMVILYQLPVHLWHFTIWFVTTTHRKQVHFKLARLKQKSSTGQGSVLSTLTVPTIVNKLNTLLENNSNAVIELFKCLKQTTRKKRGEDRPVFWVKGWCFMPPRICVHFCLYIVFNSQQEKIKATTLNGFHCQLPLPFT